MKSNWATRWKGLMKLKWKLIMKQEMENAVNKSKNRKQNLYLKGEHTRKKARCERESGYCSGGAAAKYPDQSMFGKVCLLRPPRDDQVSSC